MGDGLFGFDDIINGIHNEEIVDTFRVMARSISAMHKELIKEGYNEELALQITMEYIRGLLGGE